MEASEDEETRSRLVDELSISRVIDQELRTQVGMARCLFSTGIGEKDESFCVAGRQVSSMCLEVDVKSQIVRQLLEYDGAARGVALGAEGFVGHLFREVSALRLGEKQWLSNERRDVCIGADIARPLEFEPSVTERL
jgi:hypothetical protein